ncbi:MAG: tRNA preQ1(34) S-adenosylmethionine ribosyltransferase-isomerase QueA [Acidobacteria bacterium]|nr:tRNA preQ1(34) S-adenosylmethionine ribosyltransferase-isomerase QueA [Acidobacteriota bacterium]
MQLHDFNYHLPLDLIAQHPPRRRTDSRMLLLNRTTGEIQDRQFRELPEILQAGDVLALNNSRVIPARLLGRRVGVRAMAIGKNHPKREEYLTSEIEAMLARQIDERTWEALVRPGKKIRVGEQLVFEAATSAAGQATGKHSEYLKAEVIARGEYGLRTLRFEESKSLQRLIERIGHIPLPPYILRPGNHLDDRADRLRYQTVYARQSGSVAAPTAGLHFTRPMLNKLSQRGIARAEITLHVGLGTFQPIHTEKIEEHVMHPERYEVSEAVAEQLASARREVRRIVAVGTTTVRTLEHIAAANSGRITVGSGNTRLFIQPGFPFQVIGGMLTNFHLPQSTLLMLVSAFAGREHVLAAYEHAVRERYRFYSYGDCMLIL